MSKVNAGQASSTLIPKYIGSDFDKVVVVADNIEDVAKVADNLEDLMLVMPYVEEIVTVAGMEQEVKTVARNEASVNTVAANVPVITTVADNIADVVAVGNDMDDVKAIVDDMPIIREVGENIDDVSTVADGMDYVVEVAEGLHGMPVTTYTGPTPPAIDPIPEGVNWFCTENGRTYLWYVDEDSAQWVESTPQSGAITYNEGGGNGGVTDHGNLDGLGDDDHPQYLTQARGDARYAPIGSSGGGGGSPYGGWFGGKKWYSLGTSITIDGSYTNPLRDKSGMVLVNIGTSGQTLSTAGGNAGGIYNSMINSLGADAEVVTMETINDFRLNVPLGTIDDPEDHSVSYYGALRAACNWLLTNRPAARVFFFTAYGDAMDAGYPNGETQNNLGFWYWEYNVAMKEVAAIYGIPVIDVAGESGINFHTCQFYTTDMIHMNSLGGTRYAEYVWSKIAPIGWDSSRPTVPSGGGSVAVTGVTINQGDAQTVDTDATLQCSVTIAPSNASNKTVYWATSNAGVATVSLDGLVRGIAAGTANVTATTADGGFVDTIVITVVGGGSGEPPVEAWNLTLQTSFEGFNVVGLRADTPGTPVWDSETGTYPGIILNSVDAGHNACEYEITMAPGSYGWSMFGCNRTSGEYAAVGDWSMGPSYAGLTDASGDLTMDAVVWVKAPIFGQYPWAAGARFRMARVGNNVHGWYFNTSDSTWVHFYELDLTQQPKYIANPNCYIDHGLGILVGDANYTHVINVMTGTYTLDGGSLVPAEGVTVSPEGTTAVYVGDTVQCYANVLPATATERGVVWSSDNAAIASVNTVGLVTGMAEGTARITATTVDGGFTDYVDVTVTIAPPSSWNLELQSNFEGFLLTNLRATAPGTPAWDSVDGTYGGVIFNSIDLGHNAIEFETTHIPAHGCWNMVGCNRTDGIWSGTGDYNQGVPFFAGNIDAAGSISNQTINNWLIAPTDYNWGVGTKFRFARLANIVSGWYYEPSVSDWVKFYELDLTTSGKFQENPASWSEFGLGLICGGGYTSAINVKTGTYSV